MKRTRMLIKFLAVAGVLLAALAIFIQLRPSHFRVERSGPVGAPPTVTHGLINDLRQFARWSPFEKLDPNVAKTFEGPGSGVGATSTWSGNKQAGAGRMTIVDSRPGERVAMRLQFTRPFACDNAVQFTVEPAPGGTSRVTWAMEGQNNFMFKAVGLFMDMDKMVGKDFEEGLANLDRLAREAARTSATAPAAVSGT